MNINKSNNVHFENSGMIMIYSDVIIPYNNKDAILINVTDRIKLKIVFKENSEKKPTADIKLIDEKTILFDFYNFSNSLGTASAS
ncbi:MAG: DUF6864 domain-containing function, partial [Candidatus Izemoplasmataceae bacterium]